jgi:hypothetical protein
MDMFQELGSVYVLSTHGAFLPRLDIQLEQTSEEQAKAVIQAMFPVFLHNLIRAEGFPCREMLSSALDQMELNIKENIENPLVKELLTCGLKGEVFNAGGLPEKVDAKRAVSLFLARSEWDTLYRTFSLRVTKTMAREREHIGHWMQTTGETTSAA